MNSNGWDYLPLGEAMREVGMEEVEECITQRKNTAAQYIAMRIIMELCEDSKRKLGTQESVRWWE